MKKLFIFAALAVAGVFVYRKMRDTGPKPKNGVTGNADDVRTQQNGISREAEEWRGFFTPPLAFFGVKPLATASVNPVYKSFATQPAEATFLPKSPHSSSYSQKGKFFDYNAIPTTSDFVNAFKRN